MTERKAPDWERIEADYRAGVLSLREIATKNGNVTEGAIRKRAKRDSWSRDLAAKIQARADELVRKEAVRAEVRSSQAATDRDVIEANAARIAQVRGEHRADISRARALALKLMAELEQETDNGDLFARLGELLRADNEAGVDKLNDIYHKVISLPGRVDTMKKLAETLKHLVGLEREAYGLATADGTEPKNPLVSLLDDVRRLTQEGLLGRE